MPPARTRGNVVPELSVLDSGVLGVVLILTWKVLDFAKQVLMAKRFEGTARDRRTLDPQVHTRLKRMDHYIEETQRMIDEGKFSCAWQGRDEVLKMLNMQERMVEAMQANTAALNSLAQEIRLSRSA